MILHGNSRGGARDLAVHLMRDDENDHVEVHQVRGFMSEDLYEALQEADALSRGTKCEKFLFSLSLSPPKGANVSAAEFEKAIDKAEKALGLDGQPRAIVFHEKGDHRDRHAHAIWSRISPEMKAVPLPYNRMRMKDVSRELFVEHGWELPRGLVDRSERNPLNYSLDLYQHAKRHGKSAADLKARMIDAWAASDSRAAFAAALQDKGFRLAKGDRRGFVAVDTDGEIYSLPKWLGVKTKAVRDRFGKENELPSVDQTKAAIARDMLDKMDDHSNELRERNLQHLAERSDRRRALIEKQRAERAEALAAIQERQTEEARARQAKFRKGLSGLWDWMRGENRRIARENEAEAARSAERDRLEKEAFIRRQREQRLFIAQRQMQARDRMREQFRHVREDQNRFEAMQREASHMNREQFEESRRLRRSNRSSQSREPEP